jgi:hypothetical protein
MSSLKVYYEPPVIVEPEPEAPTFVVPDFGGDTCVAVVWQHNFSGWQAVFGSGDWDLNFFI